MTGLAGLASWIGGPTATVIVTVALTDLQAGTGHGETADGTLIAVPDLVHLAAQAEIIPAYCDDTGAVLALGRTRRFATRNQTLALIARDGGCSFPACTMPPRWCDRHVRREALSDRAEVRDLRRRFVAAERLELRAA